jgi:NADH-quinone oxidoreductase subunit H
LANDLIGALVVMLGVLFVVLTMIAYLTYLERKVLGFMQDRLGPMEVGPWGLLQPLADGIKLLSKEDIIPSEANRAIFRIAPVISLVPAILAFSVIPFGHDSFSLLGVTLHPYIADINVGILLILALSSIGAYGILLGGWASNSKYSILGALRSAAQVISYELTAGMSVIGVLILSGSMSLVKIEDAQSGGFWHWYIFPQIVAFVIYVISGIAETNRTPFDLPEAESELVAGFFTEYSGMRFSLYYLAEYANMIIVSSIATILFLGGWNPPIPALGFIPPVIWFLLKVYFFLFFFFWIRATLPRLRYDQLMRFGWKIMLPVSFANIIVTGIAAYFLER